MKWQRYNRHLFKKWFRSVLRLVDESVTHNLNEKPGCYGAMGITLLNAKIISVKVTFLLIKRQLQSLLSYSLNCGCLLKHLYVYYHSLLHFIMRIAIQIKVIPA